MPVAVHTAMKDGQVSRGRWMEGKEGLWHFSVHPELPVRRAQVSKQFSFRIC